MADSPFGVQPLLGHMTTYCFSFEMSWGALCDERERRNKGRCESHSIIKIIIIIIIIIIGKQKECCSELY